MVANEAKKLVVEALKAKKLVAVPFVSTAFVPVNELMNAFARLALLAEKLVVDAVVSVADADVRFVIKPLVNKRLIPSRLVVVAFVIHELVE